MYAYARVLCQHACETLIILRARCAFNVPCYSYVLQLFSSIVFFLFSVYPEAFARSSENQLLLNELLNLSESKMC